jgi:hypothetical protein
VGAVAEQIGKPTAISDAVAIFSTERRNSRLWYVASFGHWTITCPASRARLHLSVQPASATVPRPRTAAIRLGFETFVAAGPPAECLPHVSARKCRQICRRPCRYVRNARALRLCQTTIGNPGARRTARRGRPSGSLAHECLCHPHHERRSFNGALFDIAVATLTEAGHTVITSDLHVMPFNPVSDRRKLCLGKGRHLSEEADGGTARNGDRRLRARNRGGTDQPEACDLMIWQFPRWWFSVPPILKGGWNGCSPWAAPTAAGACMGPAF